MKPITQSNTTKTVALAGGGVIGTVATALTIARQVAPELITWGPAGDVAIQTVIGSVVIPLISRFIARRRKRKQVGKRYYGAPLILCLLSLGMLAGCATTTYPDGRVVQSVDLDTAWTAYQLYTQERARLGREGEREDAAAELERQARMAELERLAVETWNEIMRRYPPQE